MSDRLRTGGGGLVSLEDATLEVTIVFGSAFASFINFSIIWSYIGRPLNSGSAYP